MRDRGYNLMVTSFMFIAGLAFGSGGFNEKDLPDKIDDFALLAVGVVTLLFYLFGGRRFKRTAVFPSLVVLGAAAQILGVVLENSDKEAFGDNIGGMLVYLPLTVLAFWQFLRPLAVESPASAVAPGTVEVARPEEPAGTRG